MCIYCALESVASRQYVQNVRMQCHTHISVHVTARANKSANKAKYAFKATCNCTSSNNVPNKRGGAPGQPGQRDMIERWNLNDLVTNTVRNHIEFIQSQLILSPSHAVSLDDRRPREATPHRLRILIPIALNVFPDSLSTPRCRRYPFWGWSDPKRHAAG